MPKTIEIEVYQFNELSTKAKERAVNYYHEHWMQDDWSYPTLDYMKEEGHKRGFNVNDIRHRGFYSQGDGASWCGAVNVREWIEKTFNSTALEHPLTQIVLALIDEGWVDEQVLVSFRSSHYCHEETMDITGINGTDPAHCEEGMTMESGVFKGADVAELLKLAESTIESLNERLTEDCKAFAREIYRALEDDYESMTTEEAITESFNCNEVYFHENGAIA